MVAALKKIFCRGLSQVYAGLVTRDNPRRPAAKFVGLMALLAFAAARIASPQSPPTRLAMIDGVVTDSALVPLGDATVSILASNIRVVTGANGRFQVRDLKPGAFVLLVRRIGYEAASLRLQLTFGDTVRPSVALLRASTKLDTVAIQGKRLTPAMQEFEARRKLGFGHFVAQAEIEKRNVQALSDLLAAIPSVRMVGPWPIAQRLYPLKYCPFVVYLDGIRMSDGLGIDIVAVPKELAGIEVYSGAATIPVQYKPTSGSFCGVILLWTRIGS